ncbi:hypothetical protein Sme01_08690 [Sphaerisporangium melleum]|uniref:Uncharacterized protein n=1 Tax=Sphaerisporangium melleum TaxID=321316 RepID=A0A917VFU2_9ACTN|nr:hypothetical protein GCM10007964_13500 [Sphaerisporangium melleum]GII68393.1 hypothetical protein Sme01_08690 [Sphaerisporangium melleum]
MAYVRCARMGLKRLIDRLLRRRSRVLAGGRDDRPDTGGVREPRRPSSTPPSDVIRLPEPT